MGRLGAPSRPISFRHARTLRASGPVDRRAVVLVRAGFPAAVLPGIVAELGRILQLVLRDAGAIGAERGILFQRGPRAWIVAVAQAEKAAERHDGVGHAPRELVDHEMIDVADFAHAFEPIDRGALNVLARDEPVIGMHCRRGHADLLLPGSTKVTWRRQRSFRASRLGSPMRDGTSGLGRACFSGNNAT